MNTCAERVHVAVAAITNRQGQVLISKRPDHVHQGGYWEFPGGKLEAGEPTAEGLRRELSEELGITPVSMRPLICIPYDYPDKSVLLDVWRVEEIKGEPVGREGQIVKWVPLKALTDYAFPAANVPIVTAMTLPVCYPITPEPGNDLDAFVAALERTLAAGHKVLQFRARTLSKDRYHALLPAVVQRCNRAGARLLLNADPDLVAEVGAAGVHLSSERLMTLQARPLQAPYLVAASCHNEAQLQQAARLQLDFVVVSPVLPTSSHPGVDVLGFAGLKRLIGQASLPVYALGGMQPEHIEAAIQSGAQGIAAIRGLWDTDPSVAVR